jgi:hypothetical protein
MSLFRILPQSLQDLFITDPSEEKEVRPMIKSKKLQSITLCILAHGYESNQIKLKTLKTDTRMDKIHPLYLINKTRVLSLAGKTKVNGILSPMSLYPGYSSNQNILIDSFTSFQSNKEQPTYQTLLYLQERFTQLITTLLDDLTKQKHIRMGLLRPSIIVNEYRSHHAPLDYIINKKLDEEHNPELTWDQRQTILDTMKHIIMSPDATLARALTYLNQHLVHRFKSEQEIVDLYLEYEENFRNTFIAQQQGRICSIIHPVNERSYQFYPNPGEDPLLYPMYGLYIVDARDSDGIRMLSINNDTEQHVVGTSHHYNLLSDEFRYTLDHNKIPLSDQPNIRKIYEACRGKNVLHLSDIIETLQTETNCINIIDSSCRYMPEQVTTRMLIDLGREETAGEFNEMLGRKKSSHKKLNYKKKSSHKKLNYKKKSSHKKLNYKKKLRI